jgi:hypothetical protein
MLANAAVVGSTSGATTLSGFVASVHNAVRVVFIIWFGNFAVQDSMYYPRSRGLEIDNEIGGVAKSQNRKRTDKGSAY